MIECNNCGQVNAQESNFCRFCGSKIIPLPQNQFIPQPSPHINGNNNNNNNYEYAPPRPYVWKTDEFQVSENKFKQNQQINRVEPLNNLDAITNQNPRPQPLTQYQQGNLAYGYRCPRCASQLLPKIERKISTAGWIVFAVLLVTIFPLFWIGLLIKEDVRVCPVCNLRIN